jgi:hypothetical protein
MNRRKLYAAEVLGAVFLGGAMVVVVALWWEILRLWLS